MRAVFAEGVSPEEISGLVGHSSTATTRVIYLHLLPNEQLAAASRVDAISRRARIRYGIPRVRRRSEGEVGRVHLNVIRSAAGR